MKKRFRFRTIILSLAASLAVTAIGYASWLVVNDNIQKNVQITTISKKTVCYNKRTSKKYTSLDKALDDAYSNGEADTIYVIPDLGTDVSISKSHTIESGDSLILPYEGENELNETGNNGTGFADNDTTNRKIHVLLDDSLTLTIAGTLMVGAITGSNSNPMGQASSSYAELQMGTNSKLNVNGGGELKCYGFIKEKTDGSSTIEIKNGGKLTTPAVFYDYTAGTTHALILNNGVFPFEQYDMPSIRPKMIFDYGCSVIGKIHLHGDNLGDFPADASLVGTSDSFINMSSATSKIEWKFNDVDNAKTSNSFNSHSTVVSFYGDGNFGSLSIDLFGTEVNSKDYYLPVPYSYSISICSGANFEVPSTIKGVKFLPGSSLVCDTGATLTLNSNALFYQGTTPSSGTGSWSYVTSDPAIFECNGTVNINRGFEGKITTSSAKSAASSIVFSLAYSTVIDSKEGAESVIYNWGGATGLIGTNDTTKTLSSFELGSTYESKASCDYFEKNSGGAEVYPDPQSAVIKIESDEGGSLARATYTSKAKTDVTATLSVDVTPAESLNRDDVILTWYISSKTGTKSTTSSYFKNGLISTSEATFVKGSVSNTSTDKNPTIYISKASTAKKTYRVFLEVTYTAIADGTAQSFLATFNATTTKYLSIVAAIK